MDRETKSPETSKRHKTVFIIEDNEDIGFILAYYLQEEGFGVSLFPTIADFWATFPGRVPHIFLVEK